MRLLAVLLVGQAFIGDGGIRASTASAHPTTYCGRKCNCGLGAPQTVETEDGKKVEGTIPPDGLRCTCAEVYRCDPREVPERVPDRCPNWPNQYGGGIFTVPAGLGHTTTLEGH